MGQRERHEERSGSAVQAAEWDARYSERGGARWSGRPNGRLLAEVAGLTPGRALRLLAERDVVVLRGGQPEQTRLRAWLDGQDGRVPAYRIELATRLESHTCLYTATGPDMFEALVRLRRQLEPDGLMVAVQGSRRHTYPSGMARDMGGGMQVYILRPGLRACREDLVKTLDDAPPDQVATVDEQRAFADAWRAEQGKQ